MKRRTLLYHRCKFCRKPATLIESVNASLGVQMSLCFAFGTQMLFLVYQSFIHMTAKVRSFGFLFLKQFSSSVICHCTVSWK